MDAEKIVQELSLEEKAALTVGAAFWFFEGNERLCVPRTLVTDGPHGIRKQKVIDSLMGSGESVEATCFPPACLSAASWDPDLIEEEGSAIAAEASSEGVSIVLGPGTNIKRSPLCGRNFEYFSEDPFLSSEIASAWIKGVQKNGIGTSLKHFAANSQEKKRLVSNSVVDERALREIYLSAFEKAVRESQPWTVMCSYNMINGTYSSDNRWLLTDVLREEWGFEGLVVTDWGAMNDRVAGIKAGLDVEMPGPDDANVNAVVKAVKEKRLNQEELDKVVLRIVGTALEAEKNRKSGSSYDKISHHELVRKIASESFVLLKNESLLPLDGSKSYAVLGEFAEKPRIQGNGSSQINSNYVDTPLEMLKKAGYDISYAPGYSLERIDDDSLLKEAVALAKEKDAVIVFAGLTRESESEGFDRTDLSLPGIHDELIEKVAAVNESVIVVLYGGSPFLMPWLERVKSVVLGYLPGDAAGSATVDVLSGRVNPSGKLPETFPLSIEDTPSYGNFATEEKNVLYKESLLVGYRYYDYMKKSVLFPFGFGLSYTTFSYEDIKAEYDDELGKGCVTVKVRNTGSRDGAETVEIYLEKLESLIFRPLRELKGFKKVFLKKGEAKEVVIPLSERSFAYYSVPLGRYDVEDGKYRIYAASSSRDLRLSVDVTVRGNKSPQVMKWRPGDDFALLFKDGKLPLSPESSGITMNSTLSEVLEDEKASLVFKPLVDAFITPFQGKSDGMSRMQVAMAADMPLRAAAVLTGAISLDEIREKLEELT